MKPQPITVHAAPPQNDTYSQAVRMGDVIYVSGQLGVQRDGRLPDGFQPQVRQALDNIYVTDFSRLGEMNEVYREYFPHRPAKTTVEIARLDKGAQIEVEVVAGAGI